MNKREAPAAVGGTCLLVIFVVLCLVVFALLAVSAVQADGRLSDASAEAVIAYYEADCRAEEILSRLRAGTVPPQVEYNGGYYSYECPISDTQELRVRVLVEGDSYKILQWQSCSVTQWASGAQPEVWDGIE